MKNVCILGSTGSVGTNCLRVVGSLPDRFRVVAISGGKNIELLARQALEFAPSLVCVGNREDVRPLEARLRELACSNAVRVVAEAPGQIEAATLPEVDCVVSASHGITGLAATYEAVRAGKRIGLANKETLVVAGDLVMQAAADRNAEILPIDSEHCAVHQCLRSGQSHEVRRLILTGSGGPFRTTPKKAFRAITPQQALKHPVWKMGNRITIDSATLMNKGLEIIEAGWLFGLAPSQVDVLIHPESVVHSMIEFKDGSVIAQLSAADMRIPIQYALTYPERVQPNGDSPALDLRAARRLHFSPPDTDRFPCLDLAREAAERGGSISCALNAADEVAVEAFLSGRLPFVRIPRLIEQVLRATPHYPLRSLDEVLECDQEAKKRAKEIAQSAAT